MNFSKYLSALVLSKSSESLSLSVPLSVSISGLVESDLSLSESVPSSRPVSVFMSTISFSIRITRNKIFED